MGYALIGVRIHSFIHSVHFRNLGKTRLLVIRVTTHHNTKTVNKGTCY